MGKHLGTHLGTTLGTHLGTNLAPDFSPLWAGFESSLILGLDSRLGITLNGSDVSAWADQSDQGNDVTQGTASLQPAFNNTNPDRPYLLFDGTDDVLSNLSLTGFTAGMDATIISVHNLEDLEPVGGSHVYETYDSGGSGAIRGYQHYDQGALPGGGPYTSRNFFIRAVQVWPGTMHQVGADTGVYDSSIIVTTWRVTPAVSEAFVDGVSIGTDAVPNTLNVPAQDELYVGANPAGITGLNGRLYALMAFNQALSTSDRQTIEGRISDWLDLGL